MSIMSCDCEKPEPKHELGVFCVKCRGFIEVNNEARKKFNEDQAKSHPWFEKKDAVCNGDVEYGHCDMCDRDANLQRKYYYYAIKCDCCNGKNDNHFEIVRFCSKCEPAPPQKAKVHLTPLG